MAFKFSFDKVHCTDWSIWNRQHCEQINVRLKDKQKHCIGCQCHSVLLDPRLICNYLQHGYLTTTRYLLTQYHLHKFKTCCWLSDFQSVVLYFLTFLHRTPLDYFPSFVILIKFLATIKDRQRVYRHKEETLTSYWLHPKILRIFLFDFLKLPIDERRSLVVLVASWFDHYLSTHVPLSDLYCPLNLLDLSGPYIRLTLLDLLVPVFLEGPVQFFGELVNLVESIY